MRAPLAMDARKHDYYSFIRRDRCALHVVGVPQDWPWRQRNACENEVLRQGSERAPLIGIGPLLLIVIVILLSRKCISISAYTLLFYARRFTDSSSSTNLASFPSPSPKW